MLHRSLGYKIMQCLVRLPPLRGLIYWHGARGRPEVALTFDDGPNDHTTPRVLEILAQVGTKATFFVVGCEAAKHPEVVRLIAAAGHEVGIHGYDHRPENFRDQVHQCETQLAEMGIGSRVLRPPAGALRLRDLLWFRAGGRPIVLWSFDAHDSMRCEGKWHALPDYSLVRGGDIVLLHDDNPTCVAELPGLLASIAERGLHAVTVSELLRKSQAY